MDQTAYQRKRRAERKERGLCRNCGRLPVPGKLACEQCLEANRKYMAGVTAKRLAQGLCRTCGKLPFDEEKSRCTSCKEKLSIDSKKLSRKRKENRKCRRCGKPVSYPLCHCEECAKIGRKASKKRNRRIKLEVLQAYGGCICTCCGETLIEFLALDHINGNGNKHRREISIQSKTPIAGSRFYDWIKKNNFPSGFQVLCHNCNFAKAHGGCPHKRRNIDRMLSEVAKITLTY